MIKALRIVSKLTDVQQGLELQVCLADGDVDDWYNEAGLHWWVTPGGAAALATQLCIPLRLPPA